jgi:hypothetical protein
MSFKVSTDRWGPAGLLYSFILRDEGAIYSVAPFTILAPQSESSAIARLLMTTSEAVVIRRLQVPPKAVHSRWPEHEISGQLSREGVCRLTLLFQVRPLRSHAEHELGLRG